MVIVVSPVILWLTLSFIPGEIEIWVDGSSVICVEGLLLCDSDQGMIKGMHFQTFFGGIHSPALDFLKLTELLF
jgi:hypothetical protein